MQLGKSWFLLVSRRRKIKSPNNNTENMSEIKSSLLAFSSSSASSQERFKTTKSNKYHRWKWQSWAQAAPRHPFPGAAGLAQGSCPTHQAFFSLQKPQLSFFPLLCSPSWHTHIQFLTNVKNFIFYIFYIWNHAVHLYQHNGLVVTAQVYSAALKGSHKKKKSQSKPKRAVKADTGKAHSFTEWPVSE